jgi:hypothetical protein
MGSNPKRRAVAPTVAATVALMALAAGCSGGGGDSGGAMAGRVESGAAEGAPGPAAAGADMQADGLARDGGSASASGAKRTLVQTRAVIRRGEISLVTGEMNRARADVEDLLAKLGGYVASEDTTNDRAGKPRRSTLVLRVPEPSFDDAMAELADIGRTQRADRSSEDVTTQVIDVDTRVATKEASIARLQRFLRQAENVDDMIRIESELSQRQAELESLKAQQKYLSDQTTMSTITVRLRTKDAPPPPSDEDSGFLAGLAGGWHALTTVLVGAATVAGAVLPFAVLLALLGVPAWLLLRASTRRRRTAAPAAPPAPPAT